MLDFRLKYQFRLYKNDPKSSKKKIHVCRPTCQVFFCIISQREQVCVVPLLLHCISRALMCEHLYLGLMIG